MSSSVNDIFSFILQMGLAVLIFLPSGHLMSLSGSFSFICLSWVGILSGSLQNRMTATGALGRTGQRSNDGGGRTAEDGGPSFDQDAVGTWCQSL